MTGKYILAATLVSCVLAMPSSTEARAGEVLRDQKFFPFAALSQMALVAESVCADKGYTVSVTVVDRAGVVRITLVGDNASPVSTNVSFRKAYTAANAGVTTATFKRLVETPEIGPLLSLDPLFIPFGGGVPIRIGDRIVGAIGVAGADSPEADEACAMAGLARSTGERQDAAAPR